MENSTYKTMMPITTNYDTNCHSELLNGLYKSFSVEINASNVKCIRHIVRITCANNDERDRLLDVAKLAGLNVTAKRPFAESKQNNMENEDDVFNTYRYVISGVPADIGTDEVKEFADCKL